MQLQKATRKKSKLRLNISGPSGSGKTYSALLMAKGIVGSLDKVAIIDTESGSASLYEQLGDFQTLDFQPPFSPERYVEAIDTCIAAGMECIIIDSASHEWSGIGGCIEINEKLAQSKFKGNTWSAWSQTTPRHDAFVNKILSCPVHIITCTRSKMETVMTDDKKVKKLGMKDIQRENWEYELTVSLNLDRDTHTATASKDRTELFEGKDPFVITEGTGIAIRNWCETGIDETANRAKELTEVLKKIKKAKTIDDLKAIKANSPEYVVKHPDFVKAATEAFNKLSADFYATWQTALNALTTPSQLMNTYNEHKATVDGDQKLKEMFKVKQGELEGVPV